jgi:hypothetical protein
MSRVCSFRVYLFRAYLYDLQRELNAVARRASLLQIQLSTGL